jgi:predicted RNA-binding protein (virulence factor B family)
MGTVSQADLAEGIFKMVEADAGKVRYKPRDLEKGMTKKFGEGAFSKEDFKAALKDLMDNGRLVYGYYGGVSVELPHTEGSAK